MTGPPQAGVDWEEVHRRLALVQAALERKLAPSAAETERILKERARVLAQELASAAAGERLELVAFLLAGETYCIESRYVREVYPLKEMTPVPCTPAFVLGITPVRGKILSVIDIRHFFNLTRQGLNEKDKIVIIASEDMELGIRVDAVPGMQRVDLKEIQAGLPTLTGIRDRYLKGVTSTRLMILDAEKLLSDPAIIVNEEVAE